MNLLSLKNHFADRPALVMANGKSREKQKIEIPNCVSVGSDFIVSEPDLPDVLVVSRRQAKLDAIERSALPGAKKMFVAVQGAVIHREGFCSYETSNTPNPMVGVFRQGPTSHAAIGMAILLGCNPIILSGFDHQLDELHEQMSKIPLVLDDATARIFQSQLSSDLSDWVRKGSMRRVFLAYAHSKLPFPVYTP